MAVEPLLSTRPQKAFILTISLQAIVVLATVAITFRFVAEKVTFDHPTTKTLPCYLALFALAEIFELGMAFDALRLRNIIQLIGILMFHMALMVFAALQVHETHGALVELTAEECAINWNYVSCDGPGTLWMKIRPFLILAPCAIAASWLAMLFWIKELYAEFGWAIFRVVGANPKMKFMYQFYQVMICLLKFDFFCFAGVTMQLLIVVLRKSSAEFGITIAAIPVVLLLLVACGFAVQREIKWLMTLSLITMCASMSYFYKLVRFYQPQSSAQYITTRATLTVFTIVAFMLLLMTFLIGLRCFYDFDKGLQSSKVNDIPAQPRYSSYIDSTGMSQKSNSPYAGGAPIVSRISIE